MKNSQICLFLALFLTSAYCQFAGYNTVTILANDDPQSCLLTLTYSVAADKVTFVETVQNPFWDCTYQNLTFVSMFWNSQASGSVDLVQDPNNASQWVGELNLAKLTANNGSACINVQPHGSNPVDVYVCRFAYGWNKHIDFFLAVDAVSSAFQPWTGSFFPLYGATQLVAQNGTTVWKTGNLSVADIVGELYRDCDPNTWSTQIPSANNEVFVTGTLLASNRINLQAIFSSISLFSIIVRKSGQVSQYQTTFVLNFAFANPPINDVCSDIGKKYGDIVSDITWCASGCDVSIYMQGFVNGSLAVYVLRTSGFTYQPGWLRA